MLSARPSDAGVHRHRQPRQQRGQQCRPAREALPALGALGGTLSLGHMQAESLAEQELMQPNRIAAMLQPRDMQHQHPVEVLRRLRIGQWGHRNLRHPPTVPTKPTRRWLALPLGGAARPDSPSHEVRCSP
jgi:hypothetical protein